MFAPVTAASGGWFVTPSPPPDSAALLFCLPYAGGATSAYRQWQAALPVGLTAVPVQLPGRETRIHEPPRIDPEEIAQAVAQRADRPYAIYGHSMGARVGFEVVRELRRLGAELPRRLYVGAARPPDLAEPLARVVRESDDDLVRAVEALGGTPSGVLDIPELRELVLPILRADLAWLDDYRYHPQPPLPVPVVGFAGSDDVVVSAETMAGWARHTNAGFRLHTLTGGHFFLHASASRLLALLADDLLGDARGDREVRP